MLPIPVKSIVTVGGSSAGWMLKRDEAEIDAILGDVQQVVARRVAVVPTRAEFIAGHGATRSL